MHFKSSAYNLFLIASLFLMLGCKKGKDDPFLSIYSRKARVAGDWEVTYKEEKKSSQYINSIGTMVVNTITLLDEDKIQITIGTNPTQIGIINTNTITFDKDGTWHSKFQYTIPPDYAFFNPYSFTKLIEESGTWNFLGKIGDQKNKESISVSKTNSTRIETKVYQSNSPTEINTYYDIFEENQFVEIWKLIELRNKKLRAEYAVCSSLSYQSGKCVIELNQ